MYPINFYSPLPIPMVYFNYDQSSISIFTILPSNGSFLSPPLCSAMVNFHHSAVQWFISISTILQSNGSSPFYLHHSAVQWFIFIFTILQSNSSFSCWPLCRTVDVAMAFSAWTPQLHTCSWLIAHVLFYNRGKAQQGEGWGWPGWGREGDDKKITVALWREHVVNIDNSIHQHVHVIPWFSELYCFNKKNNLSSLL